MVDSMRAAQHSSTRVREGVADLGAEAAADPTRSSAHRPPTPPAALVPPGRGREAAAGT